MKKFKNLFLPVRIGTLELKNRIIMAPMATNYSNERGEISDRQVAYYIERAKAGVGMIMTESNYVSTEGRGSSRRTGLTQSNDITGHKKLVEAIHKLNVPICAQLHHAGSCTMPKNIDQYPISSSTVRQAITGVIPRALRIDEIHDLVKKYGNAARRAKEAGFDAIQIHAGHGYLINQFLSPYYNKRTDQYGGSPTNRMRFLLEIIEEVRSVVGPEFPLMVRLNGEDALDGGYDIEYAKEVARQLESHGVDEVSMTRGNYERLELMSPTPPIPEGVNTIFSEQIKQTVKIPVGVVGRIRTPEMADGIIESGKADLIYLGRQLIADPAWVAKAESGHEEEIRTCLYCNLGCVKRAGQGLDLKCAVNYSAGKENEIREPISPKRVMVIGGGPGGMEAARVAAEAGHQVRLYEKKDNFGGQLKFASVPPGKEVINGLTRYLEQQLRKLEVDIRLNQAATVETVQSFAPDAVILATGAVPFTPKIKGIELDNVLAANDVLEGKKVEGETVGVIGGGLVGMETAEFLAENGKKVIVVEMLDDVLKDTEPTMRKVMLMRLNAKGISIFVSTKVMEIQSRGILVERLETTETIPMDNVVIAIGNISQVDQKITELAQKGVTVKTIGDAVSPRNILEAVHDANIAIESL